MPCFLTVISGDGVAFREDLVLLLWSTKLQRLISQCDMTKLMDAVVEGPNVPGELSAIEDDQAAVAGEDASAQHIAGGTQVENMAGPSEVRDPAPDVVEEPSMDADCRTIRVPMVKAAILRLVFRWVRYHLSHPPMHSYDLRGMYVERPDPPYELSSWDNAFFAVDMRTLLSIMNAANYLNIFGLFNMACKSAANMLHEKTPEQLRAILDLNFIPTLLQASTDGEAIGVYKSCRSENRRS